MIILGIETSCDETALALIEAAGLPVRDTQTGDLVRVLANITHSQATLHAKYGGVFPNLAKREHSRNLIPLLKAVLKESGFLKTRETAPASHKNKNKPRIRYSSVLQNTAIDLAREPELWKQFEKFVPTIAKPPIDAIAVTFGPGLEPALWVGINFAKALSAVWDIPVIPVNHMEGHIVSALLMKSRNDEFPISNFQFPNKNPNSKSHPPTGGLNATRYTLHAIRFPAIALLISGGHTELVLVKKLGQYKIIGETKDDAVGEAFDKVARILGLPYPGGPEISRLAEKARNLNLQPTTDNLRLPRPMLHSGDYYFSFSGLKTAVLYTVKKIPKLTEAIKKELAKEFEDSVTEVLISKTIKAIKEYEAKTLIIAGGVIANKHIRASFEELQQSAFPALSLLIPEIPHSTDNALMIALAGYLNIKSGRKLQKAGKLKIIAEGRVRLT